MCCVYAMGYSISGLNVRYRTYDPWLRARLIYFMVPYGGVVPVRAKIYGAVRTVSNLEHVRNILFPYGPYPLYPAYRASVFSADWDTVQSRMTQH